MENLSRLVSDSLAQNGVSIALNHRRLEWSRWFRCESSFSVLLAPSKPGIFALGEEIAPDDGSKRMLALFEIIETDDLGLALGRLFLPRSPLRNKLEAGGCYARFTVIEDAAERACAHAALRSWMDQSGKTASGPTSRDRSEARGSDVVVGGDPENILAAAPVGEAQRSRSFPWGMEAPSRELNGKVVGPTPLPSGF